MSKILYLSSWICEDAGVYVRYNKCSRDIIQVCHIHETIHIFTQVIHVIHGLHQFIRIRHLVEIAMLSFYIIQRPREILSKFTEKNADVSAMSILFTDCQLLKIKKYKHICQAFMPTGTCKRKSCCSTALARFPKYSESLWPSRACRNWFCRPAAAAWSFDVSTPGTKKK